MSEEEKTLLSDPKTYGTDHPELKKIRLALKAFGINQKNARYAAILLVEKRDGEADLRAAAVGILGREKFEEIYHSDKELQTIFKEAKVGDIINLTSYSMPMKLEAEQETLTRVGGVLKAGGALGLAKVASEALFAPQLSISELIFYGLLMGVAGDIGASGSVEAIGGRSHQPIGAQGIEYGLKRGGLSESEAHYIAELGYDLFAIGGGIVAFRTVLANMPKGGIGTPKEILTGEEFVHVAPKRFAGSIAERGLDPSVSGGRVYVTKLKYIEGKTPAELETLLYNKALQPSKVGRFTEGGTVRVILPEGVKVHYRGMTTHPGVPQWTYEGEPLKNILIIPGE
jgi:hypothetical protein